jgi:uncharacterized RDD family membrane protein YckC
MIWLGLFFIYFTMFGYLGGQTPGKMLFGIQVQSVALAPLSGGQAVLRALSYVFSSLFLGAGFFFMLLNKDRRALHDFIAGTRVVHL